MYRTISACIFYGCVVEVKDPNFIFNKRSDWQIVKGPKLPSANENFRSATWQEYREKVAEWAKTGLCVDVVSIGEKNPIGELFSKMGITLSSLCYYCYSGAIVVPKLPEVTEEQREAILEFCAECNIKPGVFNWYLCYQF